MSTSPINLTKTPPEHAVGAVFDDPVGYLAGLGIESVLIAEFWLPAAA